MSTDNPIEEKPHDLPTSDSVPFQPEVFEHSVAFRFEQVANRFPTNIAVKAKDRAITYEELNRRANRLAHTILARRGEGEEPVALLFESDLPAIVAVFGTVKAGKFYIPLDVSHPADRNRDILERSGAALLVTAEQHADLAASLAGGLGIDVLILDEVGTDTPDHNPNLPLSPETLLCVHYTSGSTGQPKGVLFDHDYLMKGVSRDRKSFPLSERDRTAALSSYAFAAAMANIYHLLLHGGTMCLFDLKQEGLEKMVRWFAEEKITYTFMNPTFLRHIAHFVSQATEELDFSNLRLVIMGGEPVTRSDVETFWRIFPASCRVINTIGATEGGRFAEFPLDPHTEFEGDLVPLGRSLEEVEVLLLDEEGNEVGFDTPGEMVIRSDALARGYWRDPELTDRKFAPDPQGGNRRMFYTGDMALRRPDGSLETLGRADLQVKIRGFRVEVAEVEQLLLAHDAIKEVALAAQEDVRGEKRLVAYVVPAGESAPSIGEMRELLEEKLPDYMMPAFFVTLDALPLTATGKTDRRALPPPDTSRPELDNPYVAPRDDLEAQLVDIWESVLGIHPVGIDDNFFELGGHSLLALQLFTRVEKDLKRTLPLDALFRASTIEDFAAALREDEATHARSLLVTLNPGGEKPPLYLVHPTGGHLLRYYHLVRHLEPDRPVYGLEAQGLDGKTEPYTCIEDMAARYIQEIRRVQPEGPYHLGGFSLGGPVAYEMARQLTQQGQAVGLVALLDPVDSLKVYDDEPEDAEQSEEPADSPLAAGFRAVKARLVALGGSPGPSPERRVQDACRLAAVNYAPGAYDGKVILFKATRSKELYTGVRWSWKKVVKGGLEIVEVPGGHRTIMEEPDVRQLAHELTHALLRTQTP